MIGAAAFCQRIDLALCLDEIHGPEVAVFGIETVKCQTAIEDINTIPVTGGS